VARTIEQQYQARLEEHAVELAKHFSHSSDPSDLAKAVEYGEMAARRATAVYAYWEGAGHLERCLQVQEVLDPDDRETVRPAVGLGECPRPVSGATTSHRRGGA
jgi:hypothetical protein